MKQIYTIPIPDLVSQIYGLFHLFGMWTTKDTVTYCQYFYFIYFLLFILSVFTGAFLAEDNDEVVYLILNTFIGIVQICRIYDLIWKQNDIIKLTNENGTHSTTDSEVFAMTKMKYMHILAKLFVWIVFLSMIAVIFLPVVSSEKRIMFNIAFPLDYNTSLMAFWMAHVFVTFGFYLSAICCLYVVIVWYLMLNFVIKYRILGSQFKNVGMVQAEIRKVQRNISVTEENGFYLKQLIETIEAHQNLYETVEEFASSFSNLFVSQIISSSICICGSTYTLAFSSHESLFQDGFYCAVLFYSLVDGYMLMYLGNEIKLCSDRLSYSIYESNWIVQTEACKKLFIIVVERMKMPQELTVGKLFPLNMESFTLIVNRAYSMFNLLQNVRM